MDYYDVILGIDWLKTVNPDINWANLSFRYRATDIPISIVEESAADTIRALNHGVEYTLMYLKLVPSRERTLLLRATAPAKIPGEYEDFHDVFDPANAEFAPAHEEAEHAIDLKEGTQPPFRPIYPLSKIQMEALRDYLDSSLAKGWIRPSQSSAGAPILFVPKGDGGLRLCVDYRGLNEITHKNRYPLPLIAESLDRLAGAAVYTQLDLMDAYHRIRIRRGDEWKTAFRTRYGLFEYRVMPFGLTNAPATFQAYINRALAGFVDVFVVIYLDDILIFSQDQAAHVKHVRAVLQRLREYKLYAKLSKCRFHTQRVEFLGFVVTPKGVAMDTEKVKTILEWPQPRSIYDVQSFVGFCNFYRKFIKHYSKIAAGLHGLTQGPNAHKKGSNKKEEGFVFTSEAQQSFARLKECFTKAPLLVHFEPHRKLMLETDASGAAIAATLSQLMDDGHWHPIAFHSRKMTGAEIHYETHDSELLAIVEGFRVFRHYLEGALDIRVVSDHANLKGFMKQTPQHYSARQARWAMRLAPFDFSIEHRAGSKNPADAPSRRPDYIKEAEELKRGSHPQEKLFSRIRRSLMRGPLREQLEGDNTLAIIRTRSAAARNPSYETEKEASTTPVEEEQDAHEHVRTHEAQLQAHEMPTQGSVDEYQGAGGDSVPDRLTTQAEAVNAAVGEAPRKEHLTESMSELIRTVQGRDPTLRLLRDRIDQQGGSQRLGGTNWSVSKGDNLLRRDGKVYLPLDPALILEVMRTHHDDPQAGHYRGRRTIEAIKRKFYWKGMVPMIKQYVDECNVCQQNIVHRHRPYGLLEPLPVPQGPLQWMSMDFITGLPPSKIGDTVYNAILVIVDLYTKFAVYIPCRKDIDADQLAFLLVERVISWLGMPLNLVSDRGSLFTSEFWTQFCFLLGVRRRLSTAFHPQTDGQTERQNQTLEYYLRNYVSWNQDDWARWLPIAQFTYNQTTHSALKISPAEALLGVKPELRSSVETEPPVYSESATARVDEMVKMRQHLTQRLQEAKEKMKRSADKRRQDLTLRVGDWVYLSSAHIASGRPNPKLDHRRIGPFQIARKIGAQAYQLILTPRFRNIHPTQHISTLEPCQGVPKMGERPVPIEVDGESEYTIDRILSQRKRGTGYQYLVHWKGYNHEEDTWEPRSNLEDTEALGIWEQRASGANAAKKDEKGQRTYTGAIRPRTGRKKWTWKGLTGARPRKRPHNPNRPIGAATGQAGGFAGNVPP